MSSRATGVKTQLGLGLYDQSDHIVCGGLKNGLGAATMGNPDDSIMNECS